MGLFCVWEGVFGGKGGVYGAAVHTQGGAHTKRSVATAGVMLFRGGAGAGPCVERSEPYVEQCQLRRGKGEV